MNHSIKICKTAVWLKINTGADIKIISTKTYKNLREKHLLKPVNGTFTSPGGIVQFIGKFNTATAENRTNIIWRYMSLDV